MAAEINEYNYDKLLDLTARYNRRLHNDKLSRLPFLDNATGIAQRPCLLYRNSYERETGLIAQIYHYPPHRWKKTKRTPVSNVVCHAETWNGLSKSAHTSSQDPNIRENEDDDSRSTWAAGPDYDMDSDASELIDETYGSRRRRRKPRPSRMNRSFGATGSSSRRRSQNYPNYNILDEDSNDKPISAPVFVCDVCGVRYKSRTGLNYHYNSQHPQVNRGSNSRTATIVDTQSHAPSHPNGTSYCVTSATATARSSHVLHSPGLGLNVIPNRGDLIDESSNRSKPGTTNRGSSIVEPGDHWRSAFEGEFTCDFCLGNERLNKKTGRPEGMLRCSDCGRCAHFFCLQFTTNMIASIKTYRWQCIECKTCWLCGTSENDEQMLFCDDCDRGYHMYCLTPPLSEPPEGSWSCKLCVEHFQEAAASNQNPPDTMPKSLPASNSPDRELEGDKSVILSVISLNHGIPSSSGT